MKVKLIPLAIICLLALSLAACAQSGKQYNVSFTYDDFTRNKYQTLTIDDASAGDKITITLPSNGTTGFQWSLTGISDKTVVAQEGKSQYLTPKSTLAGAGGQEVWTFKALKTGTSTISLEYSQSWQGGTKGAWTFTANVTVK